MDIDIVALIVHCIRVELEFGKCWFLQRGENRNTRRKTSRSREENQQQTQPTYDPSAGIEPGPHCWEASALTTAPSLLPQERFKTKWGWVVTTMPAQWGRSVLVLLKLNFLDFRKIADFIFKSFQSTWMSLGTPVCVLLIMRIQLK